MASPATASCASQRGEYCSSWAASGTAAFNHAGSLCRRSPCGSGKTAALRDANLTSAAQKSDFPLRLKLRAASRPALISIAGARLTQIKAFACKSGGACGGLYDRVPGSGQGPGLHRNKPPLLEGLLRWVWIY